MINKILIAINGFKYALEDENFEIVFLIVFCLICMSFAISPFNFALYGPCLLLLYTELINTIFEKTIDRIGYEYHTLSKKVKDMSAALSAISIIILIISWSTVIFSKLII